MSYISPLDALLIGKQGTSFVPITRTTKILEKTQMKVQRYDLSLFQHNDPFQRDKAAYLAAERLYHLLQGPIYAKFSDNTFLQIARTGTQISVYGNSTYSGEEFLMSVPIRGSNCSLGTLMKKNGMESIYGPMTLKVLEEIGWPTRRNPKPLNLKKLESAASFMDEIQDRITLEVLSPRF